MICATKFAWALAAPTEPDSSRSSRSSEIGRGFRARRPCVPAPRRLLEQPSGARAPRIRLRHSEQIIGRARHALPAV